MDEIKGLFRESMSRLAAGVTVVMTEMEGRPWGLTVSACCSLSMEPPLLLVSLASTSASAKAIQQNQSFSVSLLGEDQTDVARAGATPGQPKFFEDYTEEAGGAYFNVKQALANIHCSVDRIIEAGDHTIFIGMVEKVRLGESKEPLLYFNRQFGKFQTQVNSL